MLSKLSSLKFARDTGVQYNVCNLIELYFYLVDSPEAMEFACLSN